MSRCSGNTWLLLHQPHRRQHPQLHTSCLTSSSCGSAGDGPAGDGQDGSLELVQVQPFVLAGLRLAEHDLLVVQPYALGKELASWLEDEQLVAVSSFGSSAFHDWEQAVFRQQAHLQLVSEQSLVDNRPGVEQASGQAVTVAERAVVVG